MIFVTTDVHRATNDARVAIEVTCALNINIVASIDAGRIGLKMEIPAREVNKERFIGDAAKTWNGTSVVWLYPIII